MGRNTDDETLDDDRDGSQGDASQSEAELEGQEQRADEDRAADDTGDGDDAKDSAGFKKRVSKLTAQRRRAESERDAARTELAAYKRKEREAAEAAKREREATPEGKKAEERRAAIRATIDEAYGEGASDILDEQREERQLRREKYAMEGLSYLKSELTDHGVAVDDATVLRWEHAVGSELQEDPQLLAMFKRPSTQEQAIKEAFNRVAQGLVNPILKQKGGKELTRIERNRAAFLGSGRNEGGADASPPVADDYEAKPPKNLKGQALSDWWVDHRDTLWKKLQNASA